MPENDRYDVIIVGGSVGGCVLALCYARRNLRIAILEQRPEPTDYKTLCTHFVQPMALPVLFELGLDEALEERGALRTKAAFWTAAGWIDPPEGYGVDSSTAHAYNIERRLLDPFLRESVLRFESIDLCLGHRVVGVEPANGEWRVEAIAEKKPRTLSARLVVAADGRHSQMAKLSGNESEQQENQRSALFGYFEGIAAPDYNRSLFILSEPERGFLYPLCSGRTLLAQYVPKLGPEDWQSQRTSWADDVKAYFHRFRGVPDLSDGRLVSPVFGYSDYPNLARKANWKGMAFIGDAALSLDPLSGVGCAFAMVGASLLANATTVPLLQESGLDDGLAAYEAQFAKVILPHARGIHADSLIAKSEATSLQTYRCIAGDPILQRQFVDLTGRLISPMAFQRAFTSAMVRAHVAVH